MQKRFCDPVRGKRSIPLIPVAAEQRPQDQAAAEEHLEREQRHRDRSSRDAERREGFRGRSRSRDAEPRRHSRDSRDRHSWDRRDDSRDRRRSRDRSYSRTSAADQLQFTRVLYESLGKEHNLETVLSAETIKRLKKRAESLNARGIPHDRQLWMSDRLKRQIGIELCFKLRIETPSFPLTNKWSDTKFFDEVGTYLVKDRFEAPASLDPLQSFCKKIGKVDLSFDIADNRALLDAMAEIDEILIQLPIDHGGQTVEEKEVVKQVKERLKKQQPREGMKDARDRLLAKLDTLVKPTWYQLRACIATHMGEGFLAFRKILDYTGVDVFSKAATRNQSTSSSSTPSSGASKDKAVSGNRGRDRERSSTQIPTTTPNAHGRTLCKICGRTQPSGQPCYYAAHPDRNKTELPWKDSVQGKKCKLVTGEDVLPRDKLLDGSDWKDKPVNLKPSVSSASRPTSSKGHSSQPVEQSGGSKHHSSSNKPKTSEYPDASCACTSSVCACGVTTPFIDNTFTNPTPCVVMLGTVPFTCSALIDTGALQSNFVSQALVAKWGTSVTPTPYQGGSVCSAFSGVCSRPSEEVVLHVNFLNSINKNSELILLTCVIINTDFDIIVGLPSIKKHKLLEAVLPNPLCQISKDQKENSANLTHTEQRADHGPRVETTTVASTVELRDLLTGADRNDPSFQMYDDDPVFSYEIETPHADPVVHTVEGSLALQKEMRALLRDYTDLFCSEPARLEPMSIGADLAKWQQRTNQQRPRGHTPVKQEEIRTQIEKMLGLNVIRTCREPYYSQVHMTPKGNDQWRFCIDFRSLNSVSPSKGWPIPQIDLLLQRVGALKAKYYCTLDLTSGYHQIAVSAESIPFTAFITASGTYEWLRLPMGLKGATAHFQSLMATVVLAGLVYHSCEVYLDDIIIFGSSEEELLSHLRQVFDRLRQYNVALNPAKCKFGMQKVEFVGHTMTEHGLSFSPEKLRSVAEFERPVVQTELRSFLGLANYFHKHIRDHSTIVKSLFGLIVNNDKKRKLEWNALADTAFLESKERIAACPTLFFMGHPYFCTRMHQIMGLEHMKDGVEHPVRFMSKAFNPVQANWSTIEKECFAIVAALREWKHLLLDTRFTLRTDHRNLTYIGKEAPSAKVMRWLLEIQEFNCAVEHIEGPRNEAADALSRCPPSQVQPRLVVAGLSDAPYAAISEVHNAEVGHHGLQRTIQLLDEQGKNWKNRTNDVKYFISHCLWCQKSDFRHPKVHTDPFFTEASRPADRLCVDTMGPFVETPQEFKYILAVVDAFTRHVKLYRLRTTTGLEMARNLLEHTCTFGVPSLIQTDNGSQFKNEHMEALKELINTTHVTTLAYSSESNGLVERVNKEVMRHLRCLVSQSVQLKSWGDRLPLVERILNSAPHSSLNGLSPSKLLFGNAVDLNQGFITPLEQGTTSSNPTEWYASLTQAQEDLMEQSRAFMEAEHTKHLASKGELRTVHAIGTWVFVDHPKSLIGSGAPSKLMPNRLGPMKIIKREGDEYTVVNETIGKTDKVHVTRLHPAEFDPLRSSPEEFNVLDKPMYIIDKITKHRGGFASTASRKVLSFYVLWKDYPVSEATWEPWKNVSKTVQLHDYLRSKGLEHHNKRLRSVLDSRHFFVFCSTESEVFLGRV